MDVGIEFNGIVLNNIHVMVVVVLVHRHGCSSAWYHKRLKL